MKTMKKLMLVGAVAVSMLFSGSVSAQSDSTEKVQVLTGVDLYSNYVWRGTKFGTGPALQPSIKMVAGGLTIGAWGSFDAAGYQEVDPYVSYSFPFGLSLGVTDYYYCADFTDLTDTLGSHAFEANLGFAKGPVSVSANYILNEAGGAASMGGDMYFQAGYAFSKFSAFVGAGNGWHTLNVEDKKGLPGNTDKDVFGICNIGIQTSKTIEVTDKFSIPVTGQLIVNPDAKGIYMVVGLTF